ncbi:MAG: hypothetical protein ACLFVR_01070 [Thiohalospira sp.]
MSSKEYIKKNLEELVKNIKDIKLFYEFDDLSCIHTIKVLPKTFYDLNDEFVEFQSSIIEYFFKNFPNENILFISEDDNFVDIINPEFILTGEYYIDPNNKMDLLSKLVKSTEQIFDKKPEKIAGENNYALAA